MRVATQELHALMVENYTGKKLKDILYDLSLPDKYSATVWRILNNEEGVSWQQENVLREAMGLGLLPPERDEYDPRVEKLIAKNGRQRAPRQAIEAHPHVIQLFRLERDRRGISNTEMLQSLLGSATITGP